MGARRSLPVRSLILGLAAAFAPVLQTKADEKFSDLRAATAAAERIVVAVPQHQAAKDGQVDVPPGGRFAIEVQNEIRGTGNKSVLIVNGGDDKQHPRYVNGKPYVFLLKRNPSGKGWLNMGHTEIPVKNGKVQWLVNGKVAEEIPFSQFEELAGVIEEPVAEKVPTRDTLSGNWVLATSDKGSDLFLWLIELTPKSGQPTTARLIASSKKIEASLLKSAEITDRDIKLVFSADGVTFDFQGRFTDGLVRGTLVVGQSSIIPARLDPTDATTMRKKYDEAVADPNHAAFLQAVAQENPTSALTRFIRRFPSSTLAISAYQVLVSHAAAERQSREQIEKLASEFLTLSAKWGPRMELQALVDLGGALSVKDHQPELALDYLTEAHRRFSEDTPDDMKKIVEVERGRRLIGAGRDAEGVAVLGQIRAENPFDPIVLYSLARQAEKDRRTDEALELYSELQILPLLESALVETMKNSGQKLPVDQYPRRLAARIWVDQHGDSNGLPAWLDRIYSNRIRSLASDRRPPRTSDEGNRVVLCELFTGSASLTSVAAEVAVTALQAAYDTSEVVVLRYHVHDPSPDPLANDESQERLKMYQGTGAPAVMLSGRSLLDMRGNLAQAVADYRRLRSATDSLLKEKTDLTIDLSAQAKQGKVSVSAKAQGLPTFPPNIRMEVVLAEDKVEMPAKNGIRVHEMVVRGMLSGIAGVGPVKGSLEFSVEFELSKLKKHLASQLAEKEAEAESPFDAKPLDLAALHIVAFLQNSETGEVYQVTAAPVTGLAANPAEAASPGTYPGGTRPRAGKPASGEK